MGGHKFDDDIFWIAITINPITREPVELTPSDQDELFGRTYKDVEMMIEDNTIYIYSNEKNHMKVCRVFEIIIAKIRKMFRLYAVTDSHAGVIFA